MFYVYRFLDKSKNIIYVGKSKQELEQRFRGHKHLPEECYNSVHKIEFITCSTETDMNIKEIYYINKYKNENDYFNLLDLADLPTSIEFNDKWKLYKGALPAHFSKSINYKKGYAYTNEIKFNKNGTESKRRPNKKLGGTSYVEGFTKKEVNMMADYFLNRSKSSPNNDRTKIWLRNLIMFILGVNLPLKTDAFLSLKYKDVFDSKDRPKPIALQLTRFHKDEITYIPLNLVTINALKIYRQKFCLSYQTNAEDFLFMSREHQRLTNISWGSILKNAANDLGIKKNIGAESIKKTYGLNIYKTSKNKLDALQFLGELWGQQRESQLIKYLNLTEPEIDFEYFFGEIFSLVDIDFSQVNAINILIFATTKVEKETFIKEKNIHPAETILEQIAEKTINTNRLKKQPNKKKTIFSKEVKLEIINKYLTENITQKELAEQYNVTVTTINRWISDYNHYGEAVFK